MAKHDSHRYSRFHVPGHAGKVPSQEDERRYFESIRRLDFTELEGLDDLHAPSGVIDEAQRLAAIAFGAEESFFLLNGSTVGNHAMILGTSSPGDLLLVQRNCHKSVLNGLMLSGVRAVFLMPRIDQQTGLMTGLDPTLVQQALQQYPEAKGLLLTNPNYYGMGTDLAAISQMVHAHNIPLLVDEAHGAHYGFHPDYPPSALSALADVVVQSTHKMLTAMTMGAMLHLQGPRVDRTRIKRILSMLQSSSPSYPIMASLDLARRNIAIEGHRLLDNTLQHVYRLRKWIDETTPFRYIKPGMDFETLDPLKISLWDSTGTLSGFELMTKLRHYGCFAEMADTRHVLLHFGLHTNEEDLIRLMEALTAISLDAFSEKKENSKASENIYAIQPHPAISIPVSFGLPVERVASPTQLRIPLTKAVGKQSAEMVIPYPPGIPVLYPGETISEWAAIYLQELAECGATFQGLKHVTEFGIPIITPDVENK
jgi:arginine/lysine/ornithine decarboxylase